MAPKLWFKAKTKKEKRNLVISEVIKMEEKTYKISNVRAIGQPGRQS